MNNCPEATIKSCFIRIQYFNELLVLNVLPVYFIWYVASIRSIYMCTKHAGNMKGICLFMETCKGKDTRIVVTSTNEIMFEFYVR